MPRIGSERGAVAPFHVMEVMRAAEQRELAGHDILHLEVGQPSTSAPEQALRAAEEALRSDRLGYTTALGLPLLRQKIASWYQLRYGLEIPVERVIATTGASGSCVLAFLALWDTGARVGVLEPGYPCYRNDLLAFGIEPVAIPVGPDTDYRPTIAHLEAAGSLDGLVIASPSNPTGTVLYDQHLAEILGWARANDVLVVMDEIYHGITYGDSPVPTALAHDDDVVVFNSFSKYFSMTGWRLGWIIAPEYLVTSLERLAQNLTIAPPTLSQLAGIAAFDCTEELDRNVESYRVNRQILLDGLPAAGITKIAPPDGAFYIWADVSHLVDSQTTTSSQTLSSSQTLCSRWLEDLDLAATPGVDFDPVRGQHFVRFSYAQSAADMQQAMERLASWTHRRVRS
jgi:aspartate/methionine/tyrosine aminotransferase